MHLSRLFIKNYRSIQEIDITFSKGKNVIVGRNNAGKSNIVKALDLVLGENSPTYNKSENITDNDFYSWKELDKNGNQVASSSDEIHIWCELSREVGESLNYADMYECYGFYIASHNKKDPYKVSAKLPEEFNRIHDFDADSDKEICKNKAYINTKNPQYSVLENQFANKYCFAFSFRAKKNQTIEKSIRFLYRENAQSSWVLAFSAPIRCELLQSAIIPSFRDPQTQLRLTNWSWYGKLMKRLTSDTSSSTKLQEAFAQVQSVADDAFSDIKSTISQSSISVAFPGTELSFQFNTETKVDLYKNAVIYVDDGFKSQLIDKGSGIQSATTIGLFNYYTQKVNIKTSALLCVEEPEVYLHPHARRVVSDNLDKFLDGGRNQTIITTHSTEFLRTTSDDMNIVLINKTTNGTSGKSINIKRYKELLLNNDQNELFFADKVIVCEGYDNYILREVAKVKFPGKLDEQNISVVNVGGKNNISKLVKLVLELGLPCYIFCDFDYLLRDKLPDGKDYEAKEHENINSCVSNFFKQEYVMNSGCVDLQSKLQKLHLGLKALNKKVFYLGKQATEFDHPTLLNDLQKYRKLGIGILSGEIEHLSLNEDFLKPDSKKLSLEKIFELNKRLLNGEDISAIIKTDEIEEFLTAVFDPQCF